MVFNEYLFVWITFPFETINLGKNKILDISRSVTFQLKSNYDIRHERHFSKYQVKKYINMFYKRCIFSIK